MDNLANQKILIFNQNWRWEHGNAQMGTCESEYVQLEFK